MPSNTINRNPEADPCDIVELLKPLNSLAKMWRRQFGTLTGLMILSAAHAAERAPTVGAECPEGQSDA